MTDVEREESETGKFAWWVYVKNWVSDYLKTTDLNIDGSKNVGVNVQNHPADYPDSEGEWYLSEIYAELVQKLENSHLNIDGSKNVGVNVKTIQEEDPDAATKNNPSYAITYGYGGILSYIDMTIGAQTFRRTFTYSGSQLTAIGAWYQI